MYIVVGIDYNFTIDYQLGVKFSIDWLLSNNQKTFFLSKTPENNKIST